MSDKPETQLKWAFDTLQDNWGVPELLEPTEVAVGKAPVKDVEV